MDYQQVNSPSLRLFRFPFLLQRKRERQPHVSSRSLIKGMMIVIGLFACLQLLSFAFLGQTVLQVKEDVLRGDLTTRQQRMVDKIRMEVLLAGDRLNLAGIYFMQDKMTGSEGSWQSLAEEAQTALHNAQQFEQQMQTLAKSAAPDAALSAFMNSYQHLWQGLTEQLDILQKHNSTDGFFSVPVSAFESDFVEKYYHYTQLNDAHGQQVAYTLLTSLSRLLMVMMGSLLLLLVITGISWRSVRRSLIQPLQTIMRHLHQIAEGQLSHDLILSPHAYQEMTHLQQGVQEMQRGLVNLILQVTESVAVIRHSLEKMVVDNAQLARHTTEQAEVLKAASGKMQILTHQVKENAGSAGEARELVSQVNDVVCQGEGMMGQMKTTMSAISADSNRIANIVTLIEDVAFQTHLLALNAAIEAAQAGVAGRGFAVVAHEVKTLAGKSSQSALNIKQLIKDAVTQVQHGAEQVGHSSANLDTIMSAVSQINQLMQSISHASVDQSAHLEDIAQQVTQLTGVTQETRGLMQEYVRNSNALCDQVKHLDQALTHFSLSSHQPSNKSDYQ